MKPTQVTELFANVKKTFVSFFSILMFVALGVGIFLGISWSGPALQNAADRVYDEGAFHDFQVQFVYGLTDGDLEKLGAVEGVSDVEAGYQSFQGLELGGKDYTVKVQSLGQRIDMSLVVEGELPSADDEVAIGAFAARQAGISVGDTLTFAEAAGSTAAMPAIEGEGEGSSEGEGADEDGGLSCLTSTTFTVTALVNSPEYLANDADTYGSSSTPSGRVDLLAWVLPGAFKSSAFHDGYPIVNVRCDELRGEGTFTDGYDAASDDVEARVTELGKQLATDRYADLKAQAQTKVDEGEQKVAESKEQIAAGEQRLEENRVTFEETKAAGETQLASAYQQLLYYESLKTQAAQKLDEAKRFYEQGAAALAKMKDDETIEIEGQTYTVAELREMLPLAQSELAKMQAEYDEKVAQLAAGWSEYYEDQAKLEQKSAEAERQFAEAEQQLDDVRVQVAEGEEKVEAAKEQVEALKEYSWTVMPRGFNASVAEIELLGGITHNLSFSMAALFVIVGLLVSYSAVSRIVREQVVQIGTKKALGLRSREITTSFLCYSGLAVLAGAVIGTVVGVLLVEGIIGRVLGGMFVMGAYPPHFGLTLFLVVSAIELVLVLGATWLACRSILRRHAIELLRGEEPPEGKARFYERWGVWDRLPLFTQTIVNNCMNDKRRVFSTVVGVAGCTALIVTAITLNDDVLKSYERQYEDVYGFSDIAYVDTSVENAASNVEKALQDAGATTAQVRRQSFMVTQPGGELSSIYAIVPVDEDAFAQVYHANPVSGGSFDLTGEGVWVAHSYAEHTGARVGDMLELGASDDTTHQVPIAGFYEFYLTHQEMVMGRTYYESTFGADLVPNAVLAEPNGASLEDIEAASRAASGFYSVTNDKASQESNFKTFSSVSGAVVLIYLLLSALMAVVVLLNLNVMFIEEKKRELIVLMINGFSVRDAKRYIYNDTIVLTAIGIVLGIVLGCVMGSVTVGAVEPSTAEFLKDVDWPAVGIGVVGSAILAFIMCVISLRRIPRFSLTDINKL